MLHAPPQRGEGFAFETGEFRPTEKEALICAIHLKMIVKIPQLTPNHLACSHGTVKGWAAVLPWS